MKKLYTLFLIMGLLFTFNTLNAQTPPYSGTIFIDPDIITATDPSAIQSTTYTGQGKRTVFDRRENKFITINAYLFKVVWNDGLTSEAIINPEFGSVSAATVEAEKYAYVIGKLPYSLRIDVKQIWVHQGAQLFGGGNHSILIHTGQAASYEKSGILEETIIHEASHTSLDATHSASSGWTSAQAQDVNFISTYARDNPIREDVAESFITWLMVRYKASKISTTNFNRITQAIPNRLSYFDNVKFNLYPFFGNKISANGMSTYIANVSIFPNPSKDFIQISGITTPLNYKIYNTLGKIVLDGKYSVGDKINIQNLSNNAYFLKLENGYTTKFIKD